MRIIGPASAPRSLVNANVAAMGGHQRFLTQMLPELWLAAEQRLIDPVGMVAQAWHETGGGKFERSDGTPGAVRPEFNNPCGLKLTDPQRALFPGAVTADKKPLTGGDNPLGHAMFASWVVGATAQAQHLRAYAGWPVSELVVDPRYSLVIAGQHRVENFEELGGHWAPNPDYGRLVVEVARRMQTPVT